MVLRTSRLRYVATRTSSDSAMVANTLRSSWYPSARFPTTASARLSFACAVSETLLLTRDAERRRERHPLRERELLGATTGIDARGGECALGSVALHAGLVAQRAAELLPPVAEDVAHETKERALLERGERGLGARSQRDDGGGHARRRAER